VLKKNLWFSWWCVGFLLGCSASIITLMMVQVPLKHQWTSTRVHDATTQKTATFIYMLSLLWKNTVHLLKVTCSCHLSYSNNTNPVSKIMLCCLLFCVCVCEYGSIHCWTACLSV
jgi:hypothetical protein